MRDLTDFIKANWDKTIRYKPDDEGEAIGLPKPFTVPCVDGSFQEMYYWDTYFTNVGLILSGKVLQAKNNADNIAYLIERYGFMPNGSKTYFLSRSQPPFFTRMVREVYEVLPDKEWLAKMYKAAKTEHEFWQGERMTSSGLNRYYGTICEKDIDSMVKYITKRMGIEEPEDKEARYKMTETALSFCESGWDCNSRFGISAADFNPIDLNALLYGMEKDLVYFADILGLENSWDEIAKKRKELVYSLCYDEKTGMFCDYDFINRKRTDFVSAACLFPMFVGLVSKEDAQKSVALLSKLENEYGIACSEKREDLMDLQWDYPHGWACLHHVVLSGLLGYGFLDDARRIAEKYCRLVEYNFEKTENLWEKYNTVTGEVSVTSEYKTPAMMGWSAGIYLYAKNLLK